MDQRIERVTRQPLVTDWHRDRDHGTAHLLGDTSAADLSNFVTMLDRILAGLRGA